MKGKLKYEVDGVVVAEQEIPINCDGVDSTISYIPHQGAEAIPWPLDADGNPLPVELDLKSVKLSE